MKPVDLEELKLVAGWLKEEEWRRSEKTVRDAIAEIESLRALVAKLPTTKDGKPVAFNEILYAEVDGDVVECYTCDSGLLEAMSEKGETFYVSDCYSTPEAAKEAANA